MNPVVTIRLPALTKSGETEASCEASANQDDASDEVLMTLICEGDKEALTVLFRRYARIVRGVAYRMLRDLSEADDLLQDVFVLIPRLCNTFNGSKGPARFWILQMTHRRALPLTREAPSLPFD